MYAETPDQSPKRPLCINIYIFFIFRSSYMCDIHIYIFIHMQKSFVGRYVRSTVHRQILTHMVKPQLDINE